MSGEKRIKRFPGRETKVFVDPKNSTKALGPKIGSFGETGRNTNPWTAVDADADFLVVEGIPAINFGRGVPDPTPVTTGRMSLGPSGNKTPEEIFTEENGYGIPATRYDTPDGFPLIDTVVKNREKLPSLVLAEALSAPREEPEIFVDRAEPRDPESLGGLQEYAVNVAPESERRFAPASIFGFSFVERVYGGDGGYKDEHGWWRTRPKPNMQVDNAVYDALKAEAIRFGAYSDEHPYPLHGSFYPKWVPGSPLYHTTPTARLPGIAKYGLLSDPKIKGHLQSPRSSVEVDGTNPEQPGDGIWLVPTFSTLQDFWPGASADEGAYSVRGMSFLRIRPSRQVDEALLRLVKISEKRRRKVESEREGKEPQNTDWMGGKWWGDGESTQYSAWLDESGELVDVTDPKILSNRTTPSIFSTDPPTGLRPFIIIDSETLVIQNQNIRPQDIEVLSQTGDWIPLNQADFNWFSYGDSETGRMADDDKNRRLERLAERMTPKKRVDEEKKPEARKQPWRNETPYGGDEALVTAITNEAAYQGDLARRGMWREIHFDHYDWWTFPIDRGSAAYGEFFNVAGEPLKRLRRNQDFVQALMDLILIQTKAIGYNLYEKTWMQNPNWEAGQDWGAAYPTRIWKMTRSAQIFGLEDEFESLKKMQKDLVDAGIKFNHRKYWESPGTVDDVPPVDDAYEKTFYPKAKPKVSYAGGFSNNGKGTPMGDGKDVAMRNVADSSITELVSETRPSSSLTTRNALPSPNDKSRVVMLARNGELRNAPLKEQTKKAINEAHYRGATFVVGDMPGVDSKYVEYLDEIGAEYTIYHAGSEPRITGKPAEGPAFQFPEYSSSWGSYDYPDEKEEYEAGFSLQSTDEKIFDLSDLLREPAKIDDLGYPYHNINPDERIEIADTLDFGMSLLPATEGDGLEIDRKETADAVEKYVVSGNFYQDDEEVLLDLMKVLRDPNLYEEYGFGGSSDTGYMSSINYKHFVEKYSGYGKKKRNAAEKLKNELSGILASRTDRKISVPDEQMIRLESLVESLFGGEMTLDRDLVIDSDGRPVKIGRNFIIVTGIARPAIFQPPSYVPATEGARPSIQIKISTQVVPSLEVLENEFGDAKLEDLPIFPVGMPIPKLPIFAAAKRTLAIYEDGDAMIFTDGMATNPSARGVGLSSELNARNESVYKQLGVGRIRMFAASSIDPETGETQQIGVTHWPRNGFTWAEDSDKDKLISVIDQAIRKTPEIFSEEELARISALYEGTGSDLKSRFRTNATPEELVSFAAADRLFAEKNVTMTYERNISDDPKNMSPHERQRRVFEAAEEKIFSLVNSDLEKVQIDVGNDSKLAQKVRMRARYWADKNERRIRTTYSGGKLTIYADDIVKSRDSGDTGRMGSRLTTPEEDQEIAERYSNGETILSLANAFNVDPQVIAKRLREKGVPRRRGRKKIPRSSQIIERLNDKKAQIELLAQLSPNPESITKSRNPMKAYLTATEDAPQEEVIGPKLVVAAANAGFGAYRAVGHKTFKVQGPIFREFAKKLVGQDIANMAIRATFPTFPELARIYAVNALVRARAQYLAYAAVGPWFSGEIEADAVDTSILTGSELVPGGDRLWSSSPRNLGYSMADGTPAQAPTITNIDPYTYFSWDQGRAQDKRGDVGLYVVHSLPESVKSKINFDRLDRKHGLSAPGAHDARHLATIRINGLTAAGNIFMHSINKQIDNVREWASEQDEFARKWAATAYQIMKANGLSDEEIAETINNHWDFSFAIQGGPNSVIESALELWHSAASKRFAPITRPYNGGDEPNLLMHEFFHAYLGQGFTRHGEYSAFRGPAEVARSFHSHFQMAMNQNYQFAHNVIRENGGIEELRKEIRKALNDLFSDPRRIDQQKLLLEVFPEYMRASAEERKKINDLIMKNIYDSMDVPYFSDDGTENEFSRKMPPATTFMISTDFLVPLRLWPFGRFERITDVKSDKFMRLENEARK